MALKKRAELRVIKLPTKAVTIPEAAIQIIAIINVDLRPILRRKIVIIL